MKWKVKLAETGSWELVDRRGVHHRLWVGVISERRHNITVANLVVGSLLISVAWGGAR